MPRKTEMPGDVRRMTAEMRKAHDNPDPRPQLRRGNPNAVSAAEMRAQLQALREGESSPEQVALRGYAQALREGKVVEGGLGAAATIAPMVAGMFAGNQNTIKVRNIRVTNVQDAVATLAHRKMSGASSILTSPDAPFSTIGSGYGYASVPGTVHFMMTPRATVPSRDTGVVTFLGDGYTASSKQFYKKAGPYEAAFQQGPKVPYLGDFVKGYYNAELRKMGVPMKDTKQYFFSVPEPDYDNIPTEVKRTAYINARQKWISNYEEKMRLSSPERAPVRFGYPIDRPDLMEKDVNWFRSQGAAVMDSEATVSDPVTRSRLSEMLADPYGSSYVENKMYKRMDIPDAVGGIAISDEVPGRFADMIRGRAEHFGIPVEKFDTRLPWKRTGPTLEEVVKRMAPVTSMASKGGNAPGESKSSGVPKGHNPALDGYSGPRIVINPSTFRNEKDGLCVAFDEAFRILMEVNGFDPVAEPTEKQREFFSDTAYAGDERMLRRTILARICTFDTSVTDPTDEQLQEAVEFLDTVLEIGAPQSEWEQRAVERIRTAIEKSVGQPRAEEEAPEPPAEGPAVAAAGGGETEEEAMKRLAAGDTGKTLQEDTSTLEEREKFPEERGMDKSLAETGSMDTLIKMHEQQNGVPPAGAVQTQPDAPTADAKTEGKPALTNADVLASRDAVEFVAANGGGTTGNGISVDAGARVMDNGRIVGADGNARNADGKIDNFGRNEEIRAEMAGAARQARTVSRSRDSRRTPWSAIGTSSSVTGLRGRELTAGEAAWQARRQASTEAWMRRRTGGSGDGVADALAQRDERANGLRRNARVDSERRDALGRPLDDKGGVIA